MVKRPMSLIPALAMLVGAGLAYTAAGAGKQSEVRFTRINTFNGVTFSTMNSGWGDPQEWYAERVKDLVEMYTDRGFPRSSELEDMIRQLMTGVDPSGKPISKKPNPDVLLSKLIAFPDLVVYRLAIDMPSDYKIAFPRAGSLQFALQEPDSSRVTIRDSGIICFLEKRGRDPLRNTRNGAVLFDDSFSRDDSDISPQKVIWVLLSREYLGGRVTGVTPVQADQVMTPDRASVYK